MLLHLGLLAGGLVLLFAGAEALVRGAAALAFRFGLSALLVGLTVVAFGTSAPELVVSTQAALGGAGGIAVGNVVGSNVANLTLILGLTALIRPVQVQQRLVRLDLPLLLGVSLVAAVFLLDRTVSRFEGVVLLAGLWAYLGLTVWLARRERASLDAAALPPRTSTGRSVVFVAVGLGMLVLGSAWLVRGAVAVAEAAGLPQAVIGLTLVAVGTSLPELVTSSVAARRGEGDLAVGNVVGSNLFNLLGILGVAAVLRPLGAPGLEPFSVAVMVGAVVLVLPLARSGFVLSRLEGAVLLALYAGYLSFLL